MSIKTEKKNNLTIIIPVFNKIAYTLSALKALSKLSEAHEIIIIDNGSTDETQFELSKINNSNIKYIRNEENTFHSKACNQGFRVSTGDNILFLNNDIRIKSNHNNWAEPIIAACNSVNGLVGPTMGQLDNNLNFIKESNQQLSGNSYIGGWCIAANREIWNKLDIDGNGQIWNEEFPFYFNDTDLSFRARKNNIPLTVVPLPDVVHFGKISAAQINIHKLYTDGRKVFLKNWSK